MSHSEYDAWLWEKQSGDWPFENWRSPSLKLRESFDYFSEDREASIAAVLRRLNIAFLHAVDLSYLSEVLIAAEQTAEHAIDQAEAEARTAWMNHEIWVPTIGTHLCAIDQPAEMVVECLDSVGPPADFNAVELCAGIGFWCIGDACRLREANADVAKILNSFSQASIALAEAERYIGFELGKSEVKHAARKRGQYAAYARHAHDRSNKTNGRQLWEGRAWNVQADAERAIAKHCNITKEVAGRWIREFKNTAAGNSAPQSKHLAMQRP